MTPREFIDKFKSRYLWGNILAMILVAILLCVGVKFGLDLYTHHGESIPIPNIKHKSFADAEHIMANAKLKMVVNDTGYVRTLPPGTILEQAPEAGEHVKSGHIIYVTINSPHTPTITLPDVIDNSSLREAMAKLSAMGFKLAPPQYIPGEKDWVYGILVKGRHVAAGDKIAVDDALVIQVGNGMRDESDSVDYIDPIYPEELEMTEEAGTVDEFEEVKEPPAETTPATPEDNTSEKEKKGT